MSLIAEEKNAEPQAETLAKKESISRIFDGKIVSVHGDKLVMADHEGKEYTKTVATDAKLTCDGTDCQTEELKAGSRIRVTTTMDDRSVATGIESLDKNAEFAQYS